MGTGESRLNKVLPTMICARPIRVVKMLWYLLLAFQVEGDWVIGISQSSRNMSNMSASKPLLQYIFSQCHGLTSKKRGV